MKVKAKISFGGKISMKINEEREIENEEILKDLLSADYIEVIEDIKKTKIKKVVKEDEG